MTETPDPSPRQFDREFRQSFRDLILWRRDVRRFRRDLVDAALMHSLLDLASLAPSVGYCQPWRFVLVESTDRREEVKSSFARANARARQRQVSLRSATTARLSDFRSALPLLHTDPRLSPFVEAFESNDPILHWSWAAEE